MNLLPYSINNKHIFLFIKIYIQLIIFLEIKHYFLIIIWNKEKKHYFINRK